MDKDTSGMRAYTQRGYGYGSDVRHRRQIVLDKDVDDAALDLSAQVAGDVLVAETPQLLHLRVYQPDLQGTSVRNTETNKRSTSKKKKL